MPVASDATLRTTALLTMGVRGRMRCAESEGAPSSSARRGKTMKRTLAIPESPQPVAQGEERVVARRDYGYRTQRVALLNPPYGNKKFIGVSRD